MNTKRAYDIRQTTTAFLRGCFSYARAFGLPSATMEATRRARIAGLPQGTPRWVKSYLEGYWARMIEDAYSTDLVFGGFIGGTFYSVHQDRDDYYEKHGIAPRDYAEDGRVTLKGHYWKSTLKPFFVAP
jgi:hypothetical protein